MKQLILLGAFLLLANTSIAQQIVCSPADKNAFQAKIHEVNTLADQDDFGATLVAIGKTFLGTPYVAKTLEVGEKESLVVNLRGLDCTTFVENVLVFGLMLKDEKRDFDSFTKTLEKVRYKDARLDGYASRLHYFSEWIANNGAKGLLKDVTAEIGGTESNKDINFMSTHRELYPFLKDDEDNFKKIKASETELNDQVICILARDQVAVQEHLIKSGDIIALTTSIKGLDITHTGIATREKDGRIHLLHASSSGQVEVSRLPLSDYLQRIKKNTGIMVARPN
ncbi:N-acetylmuramoyl-L-alanine amidase-like domain-containing protein [Flavobacteriaceae bacterium 3-367]|uniref:N-acetylmuramoyl-L-alanine amidase-like domain-containing protein n=1 Tax=Eudoraea algarum TaxID=3417568 RepID=UPI0032742172